MGFVHVKPKENKFEELLKKTNFFGVSIAEIEYARGLRGSACNSSGVGAD